MNKNNRQEENIIMPPIHSYLLIASLSLLTACGGGGSNSTSDASPTTQQPQTPQVQTNQAPRLSSISNQESRVGAETKTITISAQDNENHALTYSAKQSDGSALPSFINITTNSDRTKGVLKIEGNSRVGSYQTKITVTDELGAQDSKILTISITPAPVVQRTIKILPLGDSITQARGDFESYRYPLWKKLIDAGKDFDFVGSRYQTYDWGRSWSDYNGRSFDQDHEGHAGKTAGWVLHNADFQYHNPADIALIHLGTNDLLWTDESASTIRNDIKDVINKLRDTNPNIKILLAKIIPFDFENRGSDSADRYYNFLSELDGLANDMYQSRSPIIIVDMASDFSVWSDSYDQLHPNANGEEKMAQRWFNAMIDNDLL